MDKLDRVTLFVIGILFVGMTYLLMLKFSEPPKPAIIKARRTTLFEYHDPKFENQINIANKLLNNNNLLKAQGVIDTLISDYPYNGRPNFLKGDLLIRLNQPIKAMYEYKNAVDLNPDFLDKKTKLFQGKKIKNNLTEADTAITAGLQKNPDNEELKQAKKILYYMKRKVAGSCG